MNRTEYRVVWKRVGLDRKSKRYASLKAAEKRAKLLGPEPWKALDVDPDQPHCGSHECPCGGMLWREFLLSQRTQSSWGEDDPGMPPIEYIRIETRPLGEWSPVSEPEVQP